MQPVITEIHDCLCTKNDDDSRFVEIAICASI